MIDKEHRLSIAKQCQILKLSRASIYYVPAPVRDKDRELIRLIDEIHLEDPCLGSRGMKSVLKRMGYKAGRIHVRTLMRKMGIEAIYKKPRLSKPHPEHKVYPYLLRGLDITEANTVWCADITYIPMAKGFCYLAAVMDLSEQEGVVLQIIEHVRYFLLHRGSWRGIAELWNTGYIQHRPGEPIYIPGVYKYPYRTRHQNKYGRTRSLERQYLH
jgi:hypothetical protein